MLNPRGTPPTKRQTREEVTSPAPEVILFPSPTRKRKRLSNPWGSNPHTTALSRGRASKRVTARRRCRAAEKLCSSSCPRAGRDSAPPSECLFVAFVFSIYTPSMFCLWFVGWKCGSSGRVPVLQVYKPRVQNPDPSQEKKKKVRYSFGLWFAVSNILFFTSCPR
jgi:hypothetical protein